MDLQPWLNVNGPFIMLKFPTGARVVIKTEVFSIKEQPELSNPFV